MPHIMPAVLRQIHPRHTDLSRQQAWERVQNPLARAWLKQLYAKKPAILESGEDPYIASAFVKTGPYTQWVRRRLRESNFYSRIMDGLDGLPDIRDAMPAVLRPVYDVFKPRSSSAVMQHIQRHLEWYLSPDPAIPIKIGWGFPVTFGLLGMLNVGIVSWAGHSDFWTVMPPMAYFLMVVFSLISDYAFGVHLAGWKYTVNTVELYWYLLELHAPETGPIGAAELGYQEEQLSADLSAAPAEAVAGAKKRADPHR